MKRLFFLLSATLSLLSFCFGASVASAQIAQNAIRTKIAGIDVIAYPSGVKDIVTFRGSLPAGDSFAPETNLAIPTLAGAMLDEGTTKQDKFAIAQKLESVGATLSFSVDTTVVEFSGKCLKKDMPLVISLLAEQLRSPAFSPEEFEKVKKQLIGGLKRQLESTDYRATQAFSQAVYPVGHPNYTPPTEQFIAAVESAKLDDVKAFHAKYYGPAHFTLVAVGDVDATTLNAEIEKGFAGWTGGIALPKFAKAPPTDAAREQTVFMPDKTSVNVVFGQASGLKYGDADYQALRTGTSVLGGGGFSGRLMKTVRDQEGLTYGIYSSLANDTFADGEWKITATFAPSMLDKGIESTKRQLTRWYQEGISADELAYRKDNFIGAFKVGLATTDGLANQILATVHRGFDLTWMDEYPGQIQALKLDQVNSAIKKHVKPDSFVLIKAGTVQEVVAPKK